MKLNIFEKMMGSGFFTGYIPFASGTWGSLAALFIYFIPGFSNLYILVPAIIIFLIYGIWVGNKFDVVYGKDPSECTIDEVVGMWISLIGVSTVSSMGSLMISPAIFSFLVWRVLDIAKPYPANKLEQLKGGLGIMADDVVSALYSLMIVQTVLSLTNNFSFLPF